MFPSFLNPLTSPLVNTRTISSIASGLSRAYTGVLDSGRAKSADAAAQSALQSTPNMNFYGPFQQKFQGPVQEKQASANFQAQARTQAPSVQVQQVQQPTQQPTQQQSAVSAAQAIPQLDRIQASAYSPEGDPRNQNYFRSLDSAISATSQMLSESGNVADRRVAELNAQLVNMGNEQRQENDRYTRLVQQAGLDDQTGTYNFVPTVYDGIIKDTVDQGISKLNAIATQFNTLKQQAQDASARERRELVKELASLEKSRNDSISEMTDNFYKQKKMADEALDTELSRVLPEINQSIANLDPQSKEVMIQKFATQLGVPPSRLSSAHRDWQRNENKVVTDVRAKQMAAYGINASAEDIYNATPAQWQSLLSRSPIYQEERSKAGLEMALISSKIRTENSSNQQGVAVGGMSGLVSGNQKLSAEEIKTLNNMRTIPNQIREMQKYVEDNKGQFGSVRSLITSNPKFLTRKQRIAKGKLDAFTQQIGTTLEGGKLTDADFPKYQNIVGQLFENPKDVSSKITQLLPTVQDNTYTYLQSLGASGKNISGYLDLADISALSGSSSSTQQGNYGPTDYSNFVY